MAREVMKLHLRWWHAQVKPMQTIFEHAGLPQRVIDEVSKVVKTCRECRMWMPPSDDVIPQIQVASKFNEQVETDLMFYKEHIVHHFLCRCIRWHAGRESPDKKEPTLLNGVETVWIQHYTPMKELYVDGESGLTSDTAVAHLKRLGVEVKVRAPNQHARYIERRGAILRFYMHVAEEQCKSEGIATSFGNLLAEGIFIGNALTTVGDVTPYNALYGRSPNMLPQLLDPHDGASETSVAGARHQARIREISLQTMVQASATAQINRALRAKTTIAG